MGNAASIGKAIRADLSRVLRDVMLLAADNVTNATPVDTTHAATNWVLSVKSPYMGIDGSRDAPSDAAQQAGIARLQTYDIGRDGRIFLRNNVLYLQWLDKGWSQQAPPGFVAAALLDATRRAPHGRKQATRRVLRAMARSAYRKGY